MIFNNESPFKLRVIALPQDTTVGCDLDNILDSTYNRHQAKMWYFKKNAQIERAHLDYRAKLELNPVPGPRQDNIRTPSLLQMLQLLTKALPARYFPCLPLHRKSISEFYQGAGKYREDEGTNLGRCKEGGEGGPWHAILACTIR